MEPGRAFHPLTTSVTVQAIYDFESIAPLVRWHDMTAQTAGKNGPSLPVPPEEEEEAPTRASGARRKPPRPLPNSSPQQDAFAEAEAPAAPPSEFSDAVAIQLPTQVPTGARKPYIIFGDAQNSVDLWFFDLATREGSIRQGPGLHDRRSRRQWSAWRGRFPDL